MIFNLFMPVRKAKGATASITAQSGVSYTNGLNGLEADVISLFSAAISNNSDITSDTAAIFLDYGNIHRKVSIGDQVTLSLNGTNYAFDVIGFNHDTLTDAAAYGEETTTGKAGITFQMHDLFTSTYPMNNTNTNEGGWKNSAMRTSTMAIMKGLIPDDWEGIIKPVNKKSGVGRYSPSTEMVSDSCFLLAEIEIFGSISHSVSGEGTQYAYYKAGNPTAKKRNGNSEVWWERSPYSPNNATYFCSVSAGGASSGAASNGSRGVAFAFCV